MARAGNLQTAEELAGRGEDVLQAHVNLQFIKSRSPNGRNLLHRLWWGLKETGAKLANGRKVFNRNDAVVWLIEPLQERP